MYFHVYYVKNHRMYWLNDSGFQFSASKWLISFSSIQLSKLVLFETEVVPLGRQVGGLRSRELGQSNLVVLCIMSSPLILTGGEIFFSCRISLPKSLKLWLALVSALLLKREPPPPQCWEGLFFFFFHLALWFWNQT